MLRIQYKIYATKLAFGFQLMALMGLFIVGSIFTHHEASAHSLTLDHGLSITDATSHTHVEPDQSKIDFDSGPLHCGSNILGVAVLSSGVIVSSEQRHESQRLAGMEGRVTTSDPPPPRLNS